MWDIKFSKKPSQVNLPETDLHGLKKKELSMEQFGK